MILKVLGSSSSGNCYIIENDREALILEAGINFREVKKALDFKINKVVACLITHEHNDHAEQVNEFLDACIPVYASAGTIGKLDLKSKRLPLILESNKVVRFGGFSVIPFDTEHDSAEPLGFFINHEETGNFIFATDTYYLRHTFQDLSNILIECNYRLDILEDNIDKGLLPAAMKNRVLKSHFSYENCLGALQANDLSKVNNIVLIHLSGTNSQGEVFREGIRKETGKPYTLQNRA